MFNLKKSDTLFKTTLKKTLLQLFIKECKNIFTRVKFFSSPCFNKMPMLSITKRQEKIFKDFNFPDEHALAVIRKEEKTKKASALGSLIGVTAGLAASITLARKNEPIKDVFVKNNFKETFNNFRKYTKLDYEGLRGYVYMLLQAVGASAGSLIAGSMCDKHSENRVEKLKEAVFVINNVAIPTAFAKTIEHILCVAKNSNEKTILKTIANNKILKNISVILGLAVGMATSMSVSNTINTKMIEPNDKRKKTIKPTDFLIHVDDIIPILISSKDSMLAGLPLDRALPLIYYILGAKVGERNYYTYE